MTIEKYCSRGDSLKIHRVWDCETSGISKQRDGWQRFALCGFCRARKLPVNKPQPYAFELFARLANIPTLFALLLCAQKWLTHQRPFDFPFLSPSGLFSVILGLDPRI